MAPNSGIYKIQWRVDILTDRTGYDGIGICTNVIEYWWGGANHIGWGNTACDLTPNGLVCGAPKKDENIFYKQCKLINGNIDNQIQSNYHSHYSDPNLRLPRFGKNDVIGLIYDSDNHILQFEYNGKIWKSKLVNLPSNLTLYWCVGRWNGGFKLSIVKL